MEKLNAAQLQAHFETLDALPEGDVKQGIFAHLGEQCYACRGIGEWIAGFENDVRALIDWVAKGDSPYWEKLEFDGSGKALILTGRAVEACACEYNGPGKRLESLCNHCCRRFQEVLWSDLLRRPVSVEITEGVNLGGNRCSTRILLGPEPS